MTFSHVLLGVATGIPVMIVVGPVSLLLIEQGMKHGFRAGMPAAVGVGVTDLTFSVAAAVTGAAAARVLEPAQAVLHLLAFGVLAALAVVTWRGARRDLAFRGARSVCGAQVVDTQCAAFDATAAARPMAMAAVPGQLAPTSLAAAAPVRADVLAAHPDPGAGSHAGSPGGESWLRRAATFFAITAANPVTIVVFASLVVSGREGIGSPGWVLGMTMASILVSTIYLAVGHGLGAVLSDAATARLRMGGAVVILGLGAWFAVAG